MDEKNNNACVNDKLEFLLLQSEILKSIFSVYGIIRSAVIYKR